MAAARWRGLGMPLVLLQIGVDACARNLLYLWVPRFFPFSLVAGEGIFFLIDLGVVNCFRFICPIVWSAFWVINLEQI